MERERERKKKFFIDVYNFCCCFFSGDRTEAVVFIYMNLNVNIHHFSLLYLNWLRFQCIFFILFPSTFPRREQAL